MTAVTSSYNQKFTLTHFDDSCQRARAPRKFSFTRKLCCVVTILCPPVIYQILRPQSKTRSRTKIKVLPHAAAVGGKFSTHKFYFRRQISSVQPANHPPQFSFNFVVSNKQTNLIILAPAFSLFFLIHRFYYRFARDRNIRQ